MTSNNSVKRTVSPSEYDELMDVYYNLMGILEDYKNGLGFDDVSYSTLDDCMWKVFNIAKRGFE